MSEEMSENNEVENSRETKDNNLSEKFELLKEEVDALQVSFLKQKVPWYRNISSLVAALALVFSFGTTYVSYVRTYELDIQNRKSELRNMLQRLSALPKENYEMQERFSDNPVGGGIISGFINQENTILAHQVHELIRRLPTERVTAIEYYSAAMALVNAYDLKGALNLYRKAVRVARDFNTEIAAQRGCANVLFQLGEFDEGREQYEKALTIFSRYDEYNLYIRTITKIDTELNWAIDETNNNFINEAQRHIARARIFLNKLPESPGKEMYKQKIDDSERQMGLK